MAVINEIMARGISAGAATGLTDAFAETSTANTWTGLQTFGSAGIATDLIAEKTAAAGVTVDGVLLKDAQVSTDVINELVAAAGVTIDGVLLKDASATVTNLDAGASGTAGTVDIFPTTASKGKLQVTCTDQTGNTTVTLTAGAMGQATTVTIPDPGGASASVVLTAGAQTLAGVKTFSSGIAFGAGGTLDADSGTVTLSSNAGTVSKMAGVITTESLTTAAGAAQALTITNTLCATTSIVLVTRSGGTSAGGTPIIKAVPGNGSFVITLDNKHASAAFDGTFILSFLLILA
jgi:fibronectin-binding autotransporter adhesin